MPLVHAEAVALHINRGANKSLFFNPKNGSAGASCKWEQPDIDIHYHFKNIFKKLKKLVYFLKNMI